MSDNNTKLTPEQLEERLQEMFDTSNKKVEDMIKNAEKKAKKIISDAEAVSINKAAPAKRKPRVERMVPIRLPKDPQKGDRIVSVNGKTWIIQRGATVQVPLSVYEVIENGDRQDEIAMEYAEKLQNDFSDKLNSL